MSRTARYKALYVASFLVLGTAVAVILLVTGAHPLMLVLAAAILLVPGRVQGHLWRDFFRGRRLLAEGRAGESVPYFTRFLDQLANRPWLKKLIWLSWGMYTRDIEVMARTNLGAAHMFLGEIEVAENHKVRGEDASATEAFKKARALGYAGDVSDKFVRAVGEAFARFEGRGIKDLAKEA